MSEKLTISATLSVLVMSAFVLFAPESAQVPLGPRGLVPQVGLAAPALPDVGSLIPGLR